MQTLPRGSSWLGFGGLAIAAIVLVALSLISLRNYKASSDTTLDAVGVIVQEALVFIRMLEAQSAQRGYLATGDESFRAEFDTAKAALNGTIAGLEEMQRTPEQQTALDEALAAALEHVSRLQASVDLVAAGNAEQARANADFVRDRELVMAAQDGLRVVAGIEAAQRDEAESDADRRAWISAVAIVALAIVTACLGTWVMLSIRRRGEADSLRQANQAKDEVLAMLSHELRSPIAIIEGHARVLRTRFDSLEPEERMASLREVERESRRIERMVSQMLALSGDGSATPPEVEPLRVRDVIDRAVERHAMLHPETEVVVHNDGALSPVLANASATEQVVENLLSNAAKYGPPGAPIEVRMRNRDLWVEVSVLDQGKGIEAHQRERIFEPFIRMADPGGHREGLGLGLAVCRRLTLRAQGGDIWVDGSAAGTVFTLRLAAALASDDAEPG